MTQIEAQSLVKKISAIFANTGFTGESGSLKRSLYVEKFQDLDYEAMKKAIDKLILVNKFLPSIAEFYETYQVIKKKQSMRLPVALENNCAVCGGRGFLIKLRTVNMMPYEYLYHCECKAGLPWAYDGKALKEDQSEFRIPPISEYYGNEQAANG
ncbi:hypothetical protein [Desulfosporosinus lacus]|uniref:Uncharacterized protein n=1 Tax=Desulfosporosinus lacus DSM 15449 TaxID=1121420 RepID=A0A1M5WHP4_9FIRM|nr:hypothetical protein [Desulfosporosinus lacus]SHH87031.1 hypothetical protein SAMN02746098_01624 [Desulfosporosinus lacus DSM 15449]